MAKETFKERNLRRLAEHRTARELRRDRLSNKPPADSSKGKGHEKGRGKGHEKHDDPTPPEPPMPPEPPQEPPVSAESSTQAIVQEDWTLEEDLPEEEEVPDWEGVNVFDDNYVFTSAVMIADAKAKKAEEDKYDPDKDSSSW